MLPRCADITYDVYFFENGKKFFWTWKKQREEDAVG